MEVFWVQYFCHNCFDLLGKVCYVIRFRTFNIQFEELHQKQSQWTVPDTELRESLRLAVAEVLLPAYRSFVKRFGCVFSVLNSLMIYMYTNTHTCMRACKHMILCMHVYKRCTFWDKFISKSTMKSMLKISLIGK